MRPTHLPAIEGGRPVRTTVLPYGRQAIDDDDVDAVVAALRSDWLTTGPLVPQFEREFASAVGARHAIAVSNGTAALHAAAAVAGIGPGDEVIVPAMTFAASANCVRYQGGTVVFADVRPDDLNVDPECVARLVTSRTKAIVSVDYAGQPADLKDLLQIAARKDLVVIDDAAHALGATYDQRRVGSIAHLTTFSLHPVKHITTGEGGVVTTDDDGLAERLRRFRNHGVTTDHRQRAIVGTHFYEMVELGFNYRLTDFQCALGSSQLRKLPIWLERRRQIAARYEKAFRASGALEPLVVRPGRTSSWHLYVVRIAGERLTIGRDQVLAALRAENIGASVHFIPVPWHPYYQELGYRRGMWPVSETAYGQLLSLPIHPTMTDGDVDDVVSAIDRIAAYYARGD